jgi:hypothetical protein
MLVALIVACEIAFWVVLAAGLAARYGLRRERLSAALLVAVPFVDLVLLAATVADLAGGATAGAAHGLAAAYLGFSVAFGPSLVRWADVRVAHRFAGGPAPVKPPKGGPERARHEWREFGKATLAWALSCGLLGLAIAIVGDAERTAALLGWIQRLTLVLAIWAIWPLSHGVATIGRRVPG